MVAKKPMHVTSCSACSKDHDVTVEQDAAGKFFTCPVTRIRVNIMEMRE